MRYSIIYNKTIPICYISINVSNIIKFQRLYLYYEFLMNKEIYSVLLNREI
jgi:hypothetical protein